MVQRDFDKSQGDLSQLMSCGAELMEVCAPVISQATQRALKDVEDQWTDIGRRLDDRIAHFEETLDQWEAYNEAFARSQEWVVAKDQEVNQLMQQADSGHFSQDHLIRAKVSVSGVLPSTASLYVRRVSIPG